LYIVDYYFFVLIDQHIVEQLEMDDSWIGWAYWIVETLVDEYHLEFEYHGLHRIVLLHMHWND
jgi:hypothetical protein